MSLPKSGVGRRRVVTSVRDPSVVIVHTEVQPIIFSIECIQLLHGELRHENWYNRSASLRASSPLYVIAHGHVAYAPFID